MKKAIKYVFIITILSFLASCNIFDREKETYYYIPEDKKLTLKIGDEFVYLSNKGDYDTLVVSEYSDNLYRDLFIESDKIYYQQIECCLKDTFFPDSLTFHLIQFQFYSYRIELKIENICGYEHITCFGESQKDTIINNLEYSNIYKANTYCTDTLAINNVFFNENGIIAYKYNNGVEYNIISD